MAGTGNRDGWTSALTLLVACLVLSSCLSHSHRGRHRQNRPRTTRPWARTSLGRVQGTTDIVQVATGQWLPVDVFWGIPYAKPPIGDRRFRRPEPSGPWVGKLQATTPPNSCMQVLNPDPVVIPNTPTPLSEDCLYLNIWRPRCDRAGTYRRRRLCQGCRDVRNDVDGDSNLAVLVFVHGGSYTSGSNTVSLYNGAKLAASENVIVVSMNYRLGGLGFLFLDVPEAPGNMGLLDTALALQWVKDNIHSFGGDSSRITLMGHSSGAGSVSLFLLSPLTQDLFRSATIQSGNPLMKFYQQSRQSALDSAFEFAKMFNCYSENRTAIATCLRQVDAGNLTQEILTLNLGLAHIMTAVNDGYFLTRESADALGTAAFKKCNILIGDTLDEGTALAGGFWYDVFNIRQQELPQNLSDQEIDDRLSWFLRFQFQPEVVPLLVTQAKEVYRLDLLKNTSRNAAFTFLSQVTGDVVFTCPARLLADFYANSSQKVYLYSFDHHPEVSRLPQWTGAIHTAELPFVFGNTVPDISGFTLQEVRLQQSVMRLWANFAKFGNPTPNARGVPSWPVYTRSTPRNTLTFTQSAEVKVGTLETRRCDFWNNLPGQFYNL